LQGKDCQVKRKRYSRKFQRMAVERMRSSDNIGNLAEELGVTRRCLYKWRTKLDHLEPGEEAPRANSHELSYRQQVHQLKRLLAEKAMEVDFFKGALQKVEARRQKKDGTGGMTSTTKYEK
jgi:transposase